MEHCDLTGVACTGREILKVPGNPPLWVSPITLWMIIKGYDVRTIKKMYIELEFFLKELTPEEKEVFFRDSKIAVK